MPITLGDVTVVVDAGEDAVVDAYSPDFKLIKVKVLAKPPVLPKNKAGHLEVWRQVRPLLGHVNAVDAFGLYMALVESDLETKCLGSNAGYQQLAKLIGTELAKRAAAAQFPWPRFQPPDGLPYLTLDGLRTALGGDGVPFTGRGVDCLVIDEGYDRAHKFFEHRNVTLKRPAAAYLPDDNGHGSAMTATLVTMAPGANVTVVKAAGKKVKALAEVLGIPVASPEIGWSCASAPRVVSCSWLIERQTEEVQQFAPKILAYVQKHDIALVVATGNMMFREGKWEAPGNIWLLLARDCPNIILVSAQYMNLANGAISDCTYAVSNPAAVCGLSGGIEHPHYVLMPTLAGSAKYDVAYAKPMTLEKDGVSSKGDGTRGDDGWMIIRGGTSSATQQVAGLVALMREKTPWLKASELCRYFRFRRDTRVIDIRETLAALDVVKRRRDDQELLIGLRYIPPPGKPITQELVEALLKHKTETLARRALETLYHSDDYPLRDCDPGAWRLLEAFIDEAA